VEVQTLRLEPVGNGVSAPSPPQTLLGGQIEQHGEVGSQPTGRPQRRPGDFPDVQAAAVALVGDGRVDVAVGEYDGAAGQCRRDDMSDVLGPVGGI
jgi:hypothetical protein